MHSPSLADRGLAGALQDAARRAMLGSDAQLTFALTGTPQPLPAEIEGELLRIGQEAVANAARHARATRVAVTLAYEAGGVRLEVRDDGRGLPARALGDGDGTHFGMSGMRARAVRAGARLELESDARGGTLVRVRVPQPAR